MLRKKRFEGIIGWFLKNMPAPRTELHYGSSFQLLVAVILSAQCTDRRVNMVTPELFRHFPDAESLSNASFEEVFRLIGSISYLKPLDNATRAQVAAILMRYQQSLGA